MKRLEETEYLNLNIYKDSFMKNPLEVFRMFGNRISMVDISSDIAGSLLASVETMKVRVKGHTVIFYGKHFAGTAFMDLRYSILADDRDMSGGYIFFRNHKEKLLYRISVN